MSAQAPTDAVAMDLLPALISLGDGLWGASFKLMKMLPADRILAEAARSGVLAPGSPIVESTSGTFGLALAIKAALTGRPLTLISDPAMDARLCRRVRDLGATVEICTTPSPTGEFQTVRLARLAAFQERHPDSFWPRQYDNPQNPASYAVVADHVVRQLGQVDAVVGAIGSGGSMCGTVTALRRLGQQVAAIGVDTPGSILFGHPDRPRELRGLGNSVLPGNLDHTVLDEIHWCPPGLAYASTRRLHRGHALFHGPTSGAALVAAQHWAARHPDTRTVVLLPDQGDRYLDTVYDDAWLDAEPHRRRREQPQQVDAPTAATGWTWMAWRRRSLVQVLDDVPASRVLAGNRGG